MLKRLDRWVLREELKQDRYRLLRAEQDNSWLRGSLDNYKDGSDNDRVKIS